MARERKTHLARVSYGPNWIGNSSKAKCGVHAEQVTGDLARVTCQRCLRVHGTQMFWAKAQLGMLALMAYVMIFNWMGC